ncbi:hypothetical protein CEXT_597061 [Caerostris extrusa]|uniref:Uncharacterized protein n=1 Tax=Caerostris extrusa TaxID=172846 RepID=A0AAV4XIJ1_CAEEX|nr:hypothetical protein CEXT_597061 [Caerostris extrusa]
MTLLPTPTVLLREEERLRAPSQHLPSSSSVYLRIQLHRLGMGMYQGLDLSPLSLLNCVTVPLIPADLLWKINNRA